jgi:ribosome-associated toxin RatA of RatAB toxin-antitoxin module
MFDLIEPAEHYPAFLPWCAGATILERDEGVVRAMITIEWRDVHFSLTTRNPKRGHDWMAIHLLRLLSAFVLGRNQLRRHVDSLLLEITNRA